MSIPITEFYNDDGLTSISSNEQYQELINYLIKKKIDTCLFLFFREDEESLFSNLQVVYEYKFGSNINKVYNYKNKFLIAQTPLGGPSSVGLMDSLGLFGIKNFIALGSAGKIDNNFDDSTLILVDKAIRDEGTSYHYQKPQIYAKTDNSLTSHIQAYLEKNNLEYQIKTTWTTDAFFRETQKAIKKRIKQGAVCVEMECASLCACAKFRNYKFAQLLYFSDSIKLGKHTWHENKKEIKEFITKHILKCTEDYVKTKK